MVKEIVLEANDIRLYYRAFELALERDNIDDALHYLREIRREVNDYIDYLEEKKGLAVMEEAIRMNLKASLKEHKEQAKKIKRELKKHRFALSNSPDRSKNVKKPARIINVFPTVLKAAQVKRADPEHSRIEDNGPLSSIPVEHLKVPVVVSSVGEGQIQDDGSEESARVNYVGEPTSNYGAPVKFIAPKPPVPTRNNGEVQIQKGDRERLAKVAEVRDCLSLSQWSELLGFRRSSSAHQFLERMSDKGLVELQKTMEGVEVRLSSKGRDAIDEFELANINSR